jgi:hypothetical protein
MGFGSITKSMGSVLPGRKNDYFFGGRSKYNAEGNYDELQAYEAEQRRKEQELLDKSNVKFGFGSTNEAFRNRQRLNTQAKDSGQRAFNRGFGIASQGLGDESTQIRTDNEMSGIANNSFAATSRQNALNRYYSNVGTSMVDKASAQEAYANQLAESKRATDAAIRERRITDNSDLITDRNAMINSRENAWSRALMNHSVDITSSFNGDKS